VEVKSFTVSLQSAKCKVTGDNTRCIISKRIIQNKEYKFAVAAKNKVGVGPLSEFSEWMLILSREGMNFSSSFARLSEMLFFATHGVCFPEVFGFGSAYTLWSINKQNIT